MKKFYNKTIMSRAFSSALRVFALLCVLLGVSSSAWGADDGFFDGLKIGYYHSSVSNDIWTDYNTTNIGQLTGTPYLKGIDVKTWNSSVTSVTLEIKEGASITGLPQAENQADSTASTVADLKSDFNSLLTKLKSSGLMEDDES